MKFYCAPMEGITGYIWRMAQREAFGGIDKYFSPFISPGASFGDKILRDIMPENNRGLPLVPQLMTNNAADFLVSAERLAELGYEEVNLNLGCPSGTVVAKKKGAGFLGLPEALDRFFEDVFSSAKIKISVKTRIGLCDASEIVRLMEIYNKYPISELIVHPRLRTQMYNGKPDMEAFDYAVKTSVNPLVYNGDIFTFADAAAFAEKYPQPVAVMVGRGLIANPALACGYVPDKAALRRFHDGMLESYMAIGYGGRNTVFRMKELWSFMRFLFIEPDKAIKAINKAKTMDDYVCAVGALFSGCEVDSNGAFNSLA